MKHFQANIDLENSKQIINISKDLFKIHYNVCDCALIHVLNIALFALRIAQKFFYNLIKTFLSKFKKSTILH